MSLIASLESISEGTLNSFEVTLFSSIEFVDSPPPQPTENASAPEFCPVDLIIIKNCVLLPSNDAVASRLFEQVRYDWLLPKPGG